MHDAPGCVLPDSLLNEGLHSRKIVKSKTLPDTVDATVRKLPQMMMRKLFFELTRP
jgi:hypothetical protein